MNINIPYWSYQFAVVAVPPDVVVAGAKQPDTNNSPMNSIPINPIVMNLLFVTLPPLFVCPEVTRDPFYQFLFLLTAPGNYRYY
jgi:hypothetical protein